jgi:hypothetical protein
VRLVQGQVGVSWQITPRSPAAASVELMRATRRSDDDEPAGLIRVSDWASSQDLNPQPAGRNQSLYP